MRNLLAVAVSAAISAVGLAAVGHADTPVTARRCGMVETGQVVKIADARLKFEINATDLDGGVQVFLDAEQWKRMSIFDPDGRRIFTPHDGVMAKQGWHRALPRERRAELQGPAAPNNYWRDGLPARYEFRGVGK